MQSFFPSGTTGDFGFAFQIYVLLCSFQAPSCCCMFSFWWLWEFHCFLWSWLLVKAFDRAASVYGSTSLQSWEGSATPAAWWAFSFFFCLRPFSVYVHVPVCSDKATVVWQLTCFFQVRVSKVAPGSVFLISSPSLIWPQSCITCHRLYHLSVNTLAKLHVCVYTHAHPCCNMRKVVCCASVLAVDCVTSWGKHRVPKNVFVRTHNRNVRLDSLCVFIKRVYFSLNRPNLCLSLLRSMSNLMATFPGLAFTCRLHV